MDTVSSFRFIDIRPNWNLLDGKQIIKLRLLHQMCIQLRHLVKISKFEINLIFQSFMQKPEFFQDWIWKLIHLLLAFFFVFVYCILESEIKLNFHLFLIDTHWCVLVLQLDESFFHNYVLFLFVCDHVLESLSFKFVICGKVVQLLVGLNDFIKHGHPLLEGIFCLIIKSRSPLF